MIRLSKPEFDYKCEIIFSAHDLYVVIIFLVSPVRISFQSNLRIEILCNELRMYCFNFFEFVTMLF